MRSIRTTIAAGLALLMLGGATALAVGTSGRDDTAATTPATMTSTTATTQTQTATVDEPAAATTTTEAEHRGRTHDDSADNGGPGNVRDRTAAAPAPTVATPVTPAGDDDGAADDHGDDNSGHGEHGDGEDGGGGHGNADDAQVDGSPVAATPVAPTGDDHGDDNSGHGGGGEDGGGGGDD
jgi:hypothetical protein